MRRPLNCSGLRALAASGGFTEVPDFVGLRFSSSRPQPGVMAKTRLPMPEFDATGTYGKKSLTQLFRGVVTLQLCRNQQLARNGPEMLKSSERWLQTTLRLPPSVAEYLTYNTVVRWTMFNHFCGGVSRDDLKRALAQLEADGIGAILDYAAEADVPHSVLFEQHKNKSVDALDVSMQSLVTRKDVKYDDREAEYDGNLGVVLECIEAARAGSGGGKDRVCFSAVKFTGLVDPQLLARISSILLSVRQGWVKVFTNDPAPRNLEECRVVTGRQMPVTSRFATREQMTKGLQSLWAKGTTEKQRKAFIEHLIAKGKDVPNARQPDDQVDYLVYIEEMARAILSGQADPALQPMVDVLPSLTKQELELVSRFRERIAKVGKLAADPSKKTVFVMVDAEQTFYQMGIDHFVRQMQREFNQKEPVIYNTYQCYLTYAEDRLRNDLARAEREGWMWGGKMVRGAYITQEREMAAKYKYEDPICASKEATDAMYDACIAVIFKEIRENKYPLGVNFGTHNRASCQKVCEEMATLDMGKNRSIVSFGQLFGMADYLSIPLARAGYLVYKYLPYGPVRETVQYLGRRAQENDSVAAGSVLDSKLMMRELRSRLWVIVVAPTLYLFWLVFAPSPAAPPKNSQEQRSPAPEAKAK